jgi:hypothetical protein
MNAWCLMLWEVRSVVIVQRNSGVGDIKSMDANGFYVRGDGYRAMDRTIFKFGKSKFGKKPFDQTWGRVWLTKL